MKLEDLDDLILEENFFSDSDLSFINSHYSGPPTSRLIHDYGPFPNQLISVNTNLKDVEPLNKMLTERIAELFKCDTSSLNISGLLGVNLLLPWDVHSDLHLDKILPGYRYGYNFLAPLEDVESRTIVFDQWSDRYSDFKSYKDENQKVDNPIDLDFWNENLAMCWPIDREYLTLKKAMPYQRRGQLFGFKRHFFHSSDCFHLHDIKEKKFLQIRIDFAV
jgi:hypothetical protein